MWLKIEFHPNHESARINANSNPGSARVSRAGDGVLAIANFLQFLNQEFTSMDTNLLVVAAVSERRSQNEFESAPFAVTENVLSCAPMCATWAAAGLRKKFPHFCIGGVGKKVLLKAPPIAKEEIRGPLINDVSRQKVERGVDVTETFTVDQPIFPFSAGALGLMEKPPEILARCLPIPRLVSAADDDVQAGPTSLAEIVAPPSEERVQLFEFDAHGQLRCLEGVRGQRADMFMESLEVRDAFIENLVDKHACAAQQLGGSLRCYRHR
jgi:hypothetical protein